MAKESTKDREDAASQNPSEAIFDALLEQKVASHTRAARHAFIEIALDVDDRQFLSHDSISWLMKKADFTEQNSTDTSWLFTISVEGLRRMEVSQSRFKIAKSGFRDTKESHFHGP